MKPGLLRQHSEIVLALGLWFLSALLSFTVPVVPRLENPLLDWQLRSLAARNPPDPDIVILDVDEATLEAMAKDYGRYSWSRAVHATLLEGQAA